MINPTKPTFDDFSAATISRVCTRQNGENRYTIFVLCNWGNFKGIVGDVCVNINSIALFN